jgi:pimeloyl-ACP methyl ester carboxylesterase
MIDLSRTKYLTRPERRIAYDEEGNGPLVLCAPGMGDLRSSYRYLTPELVRAGFRVATMDLRGHGESDPSFARYDEEALASDMIALAEELGGGAFVLGNSMAAGSAVIATADQPHLFRAAVLLGPFVRNPSTTFGQKPLLRFLLLRPWGPTVWRSYYQRLFPTRKPDDLQEQLRSMREASRRPGAWKAFRKTARSDHSATERRLSSVTCPVLAIMGEQDPDFSNPRAELEFIKKHLHATTLLVSGAGHYPHVEYPEVVTPRIIAFLREQPEPYRVSDGRSTR